MRFFRIFVIKYEIMDQDKDEVIFELIDDFTSGSKLYFHNESLWMISPKTKELRMLSCHGDGGGNCVRILFI